MLYKRAPLTAITRAAAAPQMTASQATGGSRRVRPSSHAATPAAAAPASQRGSVFTRSHTALAKARA